ncbi:unnamed protein product, partial [Tetraodon nigroviridis]
MTSRNISRFWEWGRKIICVGRNYADHAKELKNAVPTEPVLFLKPPSAYLREGSPILVPRYSSNLHHEVEIGGGHRERGDGHPRVRGYGARRGLRFVPGHDGAGRPGRVQVQRSALDHGQGLQHTPARYISDFITLEEGDLILTGTPRGVSAVQEHDELQAGIQGVVTVSFRVDRQDP